MKQAKKDVVVLHPGHINRGLEITSDVADGHNNLAVAMEAGGDFAGAFDEYKKAVALDSADKSIHQNYTRFAEFYTAYTRKVGKVSPAP